MRYRLFMIQPDDRLLPRPGTAIADSILGALGDWTRLDLMTAGAYGVRPPDDRKKVEWRRAEQARIKKIRAARSAARTG